MNSTITKLPNQDFSVDPELLKARNQVFQDMEVIYEEVKEDEETITGI